MRFCYQCGSSLEEGAKFCPKCGHKVQEQFIQPAQQPEVTASEPAPKKSKKGKVLIIAIIACVLVAGMIVGAIALIRGRKDKGGSQIYEPEYLVHYREDTSELYVINKNGKIAKLENVDVEKYYSYAYAKYDSMSDLYGKKAVFSVCSDGDYTLYYYDGELKKISDDYMYDDLSYGYGYMISDDGSTVVYVRDNEIWSYNNGKSMRIATDIKRLTALSPDGGTVGYIKDGEDYSTEGWYSTGGKEQALGSGVTPEMISNGAELVAISKISDDSVHIQKGSDSTTRVKLKNITSSNIIIVNIDNTAVMYNSDSGTYMWKKGMESSEKVSSKNYGLADITNVSIRGSSAGVVYRYLSTDFDGSVWYDADDYESNEKVKLYMYSKNDFEYLVSIDKSSSVFFGEDKIYFEEDGSVKFIEKNKPSADPVTVVKSGAKGAIELNKQLVLVITEDNEWKMIKNGKEQSTLDTNDINRAWYLYGGVFYCLSDDNIIYMTDGGKPKKVSDISGEPKGFDTISGTGSKVAVIITDTGAYYTIDGGISFKPLYKV